MAPLTAAQIAAIGALPVNIDATYADDPTDSSSGPHQQAHDLIHSHLQARYPTRRACVSFGGAYAGGTAGAFDYCGRYPFQAPSPITRWRVRVCNKTRATSTALTTPWTITSVWGGAVAPVTSGTGRPTQGFASTPTQYVSSSVAVPTDGSDYVSAWFSPTGGIPAKTLYQVSLSATSTNSGTGETATIRTGVWSTLSGGTSVAGTPAGTGLTAGTGLLDVRVEYEYAGQELVGAFIGDSITEGQNGLDGNSTVRIVMPHETWPGVQGLLTRAHTVNMGQAAATAAQWAVTTSQLWAAFDLATYAPDFAMVALGTNDLVAGTALATIQANISTVLRYLKNTLGIPRVYVCTVIPWTFTSGTTAETNRVALNNWLGSNPMGVDGCIDMDEVMRNPSTQNVSQADAVLVGDGHPYARGYARMGRAAADLTR